MNLDLVFQIVDLALSLIRNPGANAAAIVVQIVQKALAAYEAHTGQPMNPDLIHAEEPV